MGLRNHSTITEFILLGLSADPHVEPLLFVLFLMIYLLTMMWNMVMLLVIRADSHLHTPMYFFLSQLSFVDLCFSTVIVPKMLENLLSKKKTISVAGCLVQIFFVIVTGGTEGCLLSVMAYDRYAAICHPLLYGQVMSNQVCVQLVCISWSLSILDALINTPLAMKMDFCEIRTIPHYSCELPSLFPLSCSDVTINLIVLFCSIIPHGIGTSVSIFYSYGRIVSTILSISSTSGRRKAFSTCSSHLITVSLFYGSAFLRYIMPTSGSPLEMVFSVQYSVITPMLNPLVYSLKNKLVKAALKRTVGKFLNTFSGKINRRNDRELG
ncbi:olfactory receptor 8S1-like [Tamandua tetradactyla]|uniref:olfactory receptor 8S1-like n=1 Tax=Tamandua tetradactyla TaxID=48850 RepID=UPI004054558C